MDTLRVRSTDVTEMEIFIAHHSTTSSYCSSSILVHSDKPHLSHLHPVAHFHHPVPRKNAVTPQTRCIGLLRIQPFPVLHDDLVRNRIIANASHWVDVWQL